MADHQSSPGWTFPEGARRSHYFDAGALISLCGKWQDDGNGVRVPNYWDIDRSNCIPCECRRFQSSRVKT